jgi:methionyl-tRNA formyltransferase
MDVPSVNGEAVKTLLREHQPRVVVVSGTGIIGRQTLTLAPIFLNIHVGITPRYRGVHGGFWAVYEGRPELAGTTVHLIDPGVDTGAIYGQTTIPVDPDTDTYRTLPVKQYLAGLKLMEEAVRAALDGSLTTYQRDDLESRQWYSPTVREYWQFVQRLRSL